MARELYKICIKILIGTLFLSGTLWRCASMGYPQGGPRDSLPPRVILMTPPYGTVNFTARRINIEFDEYIVIKDQQAEFFTSPFMKYQPSVAVRGKGVQIDIKDTLRPDQTYALNFGNSIRDNNENNPLNDFRYVFSTGPEIDSMVMSGYVVDAYTRDSLPRAFIFFYPAEWDSIPQYDSLMFHPPAAVGRAQANGLFIAQNLKPIDYRIYAMDDRNSNRQYEPGVDKVAFLDSVYNPSTMPDFMIRFDTMRKYNVPDPQLYFRAFMDEGFRRQYLKSSERPTQHRIILSFGAKFPEIQDFYLEGLDSAQLITQYLKPTKDSISLWLNVPSEELPDTIKGEITFLKHDSLSVLQPATQKLALGWKAFDTKKKDRNDTLPPPNPFAYKVDAGSTLNPFKNIPITFEIPLIRIDSSAITLTRIDGEERYPARLQFEQDTADMLRWTLAASWQSEAKYELTIPAGAFVNVARQKNDTLTASFTVAPPEKFSVLELNLTGKTPDSEYVVQITDAGGRVLREIRHARTGKHVLPYLETGTVRIRVIEDMNGNGVWDGGNLIARRQPERAEVYLNEKGETDIILKENWTLTFDLDMNVMFAPITMESVMEQLRKQEAALLQKRLKQQAERQRQPNQSQQGQGGMGLGGAGGGTGFPMPTGLGR